MRLIDPAAAFPADMIRPPCWPAGKPCPNLCARAYYHEVVDNRRALSGPWEGWRLAGRDLITPDRQRITPERLRGLLFREAAEARLEKLRRASRPKRAAEWEVLTLPRRERFEGLA